MRTRDGQLAFFWNFGYEKILQEVRIGNQEESEILSTVRSEDQQVKVCAIDLGVTSGFMVMSADETILDFGTIDYSKMGEALETLAHEHKPTDWVVERPVIVRGPIGTKLEIAMAKVDARIGRNCVWVDPARWKNSPAGKFPLPGRGVLPSQHEKDAYRLALWYLRWPVQSPNYGAVDTPASGD